MFSDPRFLASDLHYARRAIPWDTLTSPTQTAAARRVARGRARRARQPAALLHALEREPAPAADARAPALRVPPLPRALPVGDRLRELERGQPLRRADLPSPAARRGLLAQAARRVPDVPDPRRRGPRHAQHDLVGEGLPARGQGRAALLGPAQLHRRQPAAHDRHAAAAEDGQGPGVVHRDGRHRVAHEPPQGDLPRVRRARGDGDALPLRRPRPAQPPHHARLPLPLEQRPGAQDLGLRRSSAPPASPGRPTACSSACSPSAPPPSSARRSRAPAPRAISAPARRC